MSGAKKQKKMKWHGYGAQKGKKITLKASWGLFSGIKSFGAHGSIPCSVGGPA